MMLSRSTFLFRIWVSVPLLCLVGTASAVDVLPSKHPVPESPFWLTFPAKAGPAKPKHVVLIAADQEYRSEIALPMLAKILAERHGFHCTVLFSLNEKGEVDPTKKIRYDDKRAIHKIPGIEHLEQADLVILFSRLISLPEDDLKQIKDYLDSGKPIIGIRTANHGLLDFDYKVNGKRVDLGDDIFGGAFRSHHGQWQQDSTRGIIVEKNKEHPILLGVQDIWGLTDVYRTYKEGGSLPVGCTSLVDGQPLQGRKQTDKINSELIPLPVAWVKTWVGNAGKTARVFNTTMGSAEDYENEGLRRLTVNAVYWCLVMEKQIDPKSSVEFVGDYKPLKSGFDYAKLKVMPHKPSYYK
jgi:Trehalose utilisation